MSDKIDTGRQKTTQKKSAKRFWREVKGHLYARLQYKDETGKWREKLKPISDKRTAIRAVEQMRQELEFHGKETLNSDKVTFAELAEAYEQRKLIQATYQNGVKVSGKRSIAPVKSALNALYEFFERKTIRSIKASDIEAYKQHRLKMITRRGTVVKVATLNRELALLRVMLNFAMQNEWLVKNPFALTKGIISTSAEAERDRVLSFDEERRLIEACIGQRSHVKPLLICALDTAMRRGEIFKMRWRDVSFENNEIVIPQTNTKTEESRLVGMTPRLKEQLKFLWEVSPKDGNHLVFGITNTIKTSWKTACILADVKDFRFHDCRHTATTRMIASGSPHTEVMKITGHSQLSTFLRYLNITSEMTSKIALRLDNYLSEKQFTADAVSEKVH